MAADGGVADLAQGFAQVKTIRTADPEIAVLDVAGQLGQIDEQIGVGVLLGNQVQDFVAFRHAADQVAIADLVQERVGLGRRDVVRTHVRRLPDLQRVVFLGFGLRFEADQFAAVEERGSVTAKRRLDGLFDQVVPQQDVIARIAIVEHEQKILAVRGRQTPLEQHVGQSALEDLVLAGLQVVAVGKDDPVVIGQQHAGVGDGIQPHGPLDFFAVDDVAEGVFLVRADFQQDQVADQRVVDLGVVQGLVFVLDFLGIDPRAAVRVVLDLDRQIAAHRFDEDAILDRDVRVHAGAVQVASRANPFELVLRREAEFVVAAVVLIDQFVALQRPLERLDVRRVGADAKDHEQVRPENRELGERGVPVVAVDFLKVPLEPRIGNQVQRLVRKGAVPELVHGKDVGQGGLGL